MQELLSQIQWDEMIGFFLRILAVLLCIMVHEVSHGLAAYALGDVTAKERHRLSFNPIRHIDPLGLIMMIVVGFGWAKPVPVDPRYFKNPKSGMALTALAGPLSNFVLAFLSTALFQVLSVMVYQGGDSVLLWYGVDFLSMMIVLNIGLGMFNLIPVPPLDGSKILGAVMPERLYFGFMRYGRYGMLLMVGLLWLGVLDTPLMAARNWMLNLCLNGTNFIGAALLGG